jgi:hypothetical protein
VRNGGHSCNRRLYNVLEGSWKLAGGWLGGLVVRRVATGNNWKVLQGEYGLVGVVTGGEQMKERK